MGIANCSAHASVGELRAALHAMVMPDQRLVNKVDKPVVGYGLAAAVQHQTHDTRALLQFFPDLSCISAQKSLDRYGEGPSGVWILPV